MNPIVIDIGFTDDVRGVIVECERLCRYEFWTKQTPPVKVIRNYFANDTEAEAWFQRHYPDDYAHGVEMRAFDQ